jgi:hypothetical protein
MRFVQETGVPTMPSEELSHGKDVEDRNKIFISPLVRHCLVGCEV